MLTATMLRSALQNVYNVIVTTQTVRNRLHEETLNSQCPLRSPLYDVEIELISYAVSNMKTSDRNIGAIFCLLTNHTSVYIQILEEYTYGEDQVMQKD